MRSLYHRRGIIARNGFVLSGVADTEVGGPRQFQRFADKVNAYASNNPAAKEDPLYQEIQDNIGYIISFNIVVPGWDDVDVKY